MKSSDCFSYYARYMTHLPRTKDFVHKTNDEIKSLCIARFTILHKIFPRNTNIIFSRLTKESPFSPSNVLFSLSKLTEYLSKEKNDSWLLYRNIQNEKDWEKTYENDCVSYNLIKMAFTALKEQNNNDPDNIESIIKQFRASSVDENSESESSSELSGEYDSFENSTQEPEILMQNKKNETMAIGKDQYKNYELREWHSKAEALLVLMRIIINHENISLVGPNQNQASAAAGRTVFGIKEICDKLNISWNNFKRNIFAFDGATLSEVLALKDTIFSADKFSGYYVSTLTDCLSSYFDQCKVKGNPDVNYCMKISGRKLQPKTVQYRGPESSEIELNYEDKLSNKAQKFTENSFGKEALSSNLTLMYKGYSVINESLFYIPLGIYLTLCYKATTDFSHLVATILMKINKNSIKLMTNLLLMVQKSGNFIDPRTPEFSIKAAMQSKRKDGSVLLTASNIPVMARLCFPPCMNYMRLGLESKGHLFYEGRNQLTSFMQSIKIPMEECIEWQKQQYLKSCSANEFEKKYLYNIKYTYGQAGACKKRECPPCIGIAEKKPNMNQYHGCPFKFMDDQTLERYLRSICPTKDFTTEELQRIAKIDREVNYTSACGKYLQILYKDIESLRISSPAKYYFDALNKYLESTQ